MHQENQENVQCVMSIEEYLEKRRMLQQTYQNEYMQDGGPFGMQRAALELEMFYV